MKSIYIALLGVVLLSFSASGLRLGSQNKRLYFNFNFGDYQQKLKNAFAKRDHSELGETLGNVASEVQESLSSLEKKPDPECGKNFKGDYGNCVHCCADYIEESAILYSMDLKDCISDCKLPFPMGLTVWLKIGSTPSEKVKEMSRAVKAKHDELGSLELDDLKDLVTEYL